VTIVCDAPITPVPSAGAEPTVALSDVRHSFGTKPALSGCSFTARAGQITVLLGPNGAGKTTALRVVTGALTPESGRVRVFGLDPTTDGEAVRLRCGVVSAKPALYDRLSGRENLKYSAALYGLNESHAAIEEAAARFGIQHALAQQVGGYSTGMKTRLALARSILHSPDLLLLDEPTSGLDPESSAAVLALIREQAAAGLTVVLCTHLLLEAEGLADEVVVMQDGASVLAGAPDDLMARYWPHPVARFATADPRHLALLSVQPGVIQTRPFRAGRVEITLDSFERVPDIVEALTKAGARVSAVEPFQPTLEDLYFAIRGLERGTMTVLA
jgi:ABC-2 type transport system ATP-binding protein